jgi:mannose-6-phosphate isomerase-like protein (cupin superfamily)
MGEKPIAALHCKEVRQVSTRFDPIFAAVDDLRWHDPFPGEKVTIRVDSREIGGHFGIGEAIVDPMIGPPMHIHRDADEVLYVLEGTVDFQCDGKRFRTGRGGLVVIPRGDGAHFSQLRSYSGPTSRDIYARWSRADVSGDERQAVIRFSPSRN